MARNIVGSAIALCLSDCTLAGLGVGLTVPRYAETRGPHSLGTVVRVEPRADGGEPHDYVKGPLVSFDRGVFSVDDDGVRTFSIEHQRLLVRDGSYWLCGLLTGLTLDIVTVVYFTVINPIGTSQGIE